MTMRGEQHFESVSLGQSRIGRISRRRPGRPLSIEADLLIPGAQASLLALAMGAAVGAVSVPLLGQRWGLWPIALAMGYTYVAEMRRAFAWSREHAVQRELITSESVARAAHEESTVTIQVIENPPGVVSDGVAVGGRMVFDELQTSPQTLQRICAADVISKRALIATGLDDGTAMRLVNRLLELGYVTRPAVNEPARWTAKGQALRRALVGGGGGGGGGEL